ncbi:Phytochrome A [Spatholobus suberectus]|nr:Phytochrome A [Spatholobus suberectus]
MLNDFLQLKLHISILVVLPKSSSAFPDRTLACRFMPFLAIRVIISQNFLPLSVAATMTSITHGGSAVPAALLNQMFGNNGLDSEEGISLLISRKLLKLMNGDVRYLREAGKSAFILSAAAVHNLKAYKFWKRNKMMQHNLFCTS